MGSRDGGRRGKGFPELVGGTTVRTGSAAPSLSSAVSLVQAPATGSGGAGATTWVCLPGPRPHVSGADPGHRAQGTGRAGCHTSPSDSVLWNVGPWGVCPLTAWPLCQHLAQTAHNTPVGPASPLGTETVIRDITPRPRTGQEGGHSRVLTPRAHWESPAPPKCQATARDQVRVSWHRGRWHMPTACLGLRSAQGPVTEGWTSGWARTRAFPGRSPPPSPPGTATGKLHRRQRVSPGPAEPRCPEGRLRGR